MAKDFDIVVYGASGFTGRLVAEYLGSIGHQRFAMAGRNEAKLKEVRDELGIDAPLLIADGEDEAALKKLAESTKVVTTLVGPYQLYGDKLLKACIDAGTDYTDLCGEPAWMAEKIREANDTAKASGSRIVFSCGFDSIPSDIGMLDLQEKAKAAGAPAERVKLFVRGMKGTFSGGTAASFKATMKAAFSNPQVLEDLKNPFSLCPGFTGPKQPNPQAVRYDEEAQTWLAPFIMASINTKNVHRSNYLQGHAYGEGLVYDEMIPTGDGEEGKARAEAIANDKSMAGDDAPKPGEGPSKDERENGSFHLQLIGSGPDGVIAQTEVKGDKDPGYGSTSKMISEASICLVEDRPDGQGGITTPAACLGSDLRKRLHERAGVTFS
ncbi:saccharopine dehydrogenase family protein [Parvularcula maris]|uniref:Saccharopine dehydrogenase NADP-binding domain-containing protein n=1 Tax=Parvularcula maris TaxID=2965077 RepID=A0A9X2L719_9PROT|nr:saccharopine dehydrogenase NADP-binding domain-containing protein [Parvularcula maris]MCQ8184168.1 saccharopine dehydrogenase NADP-binding domain-containing protein [Parvularcula maris]